MDDRDPFALQQMPTARRPLLGMTILVVEDSRFASEALRLMCLRSGARIRRADCLTAARRHLKVYRPSAVIVDLGLPDGPGLGLISDLSTTQPRVGVILATSGDDSQEAEAIAAGADGFLPKPLSSLAAFQQAILSNLPPDRAPAMPRALPDEVITPDHQAFCDDITHVAHLLDEAEPGPPVEYLAQFLSSLAQASGDTQLDTAAHALIAARQGGDSLRAPLASLGGLLQKRLNERRVI